MLEALQRDFPDVDVQAEITRIRDWQSEKRTPIRNVWRFLRAWLSNAKTGKPRVPRREAPVSVAASQFRAESFPPSPEALAENCDRGLAWCRRSCAAALATLRQGIDTGDPALLALAGESLAASRLELEWLSGDVSRMADALSPVAGEGEGYAVIPQ